MKNLTWQNPEQLFVAQELINKVKSKCCGIKDKHILLEGYSDNVAEAMSEASIFAYTSNFEGFGLCIVEALSCGLPVVTYQFPCGAKDILEGSDAGYLVPMHNIEMLADKICYLIEHEEVRKEMSKNAIKRAQDFEICNIMNKWINLFNRIKYKLS